MKTLRAITVGIIIWIAIFFEVSILMFGLGLKTGPLYYLIHYVFSGLFVAIAALIYFRKVKSGLIEGILLGLVMLATGIFLDAIITVPLFVKNWYYFVDIKLILGYVEGFLVAVLIGVSRRKKI
jgi:hypothetical protein